MPVLNISRDPTCRSCDSALFKVVCSDFSRRIVNDTTTALCYRPYHPNPDTSGSGRRGTRDFSEHIIYHGINTHYTVKTVIG